ncbi:MAG: DUF3488 and transglutaminase-like domain-containing protein [Pseudomonadota bacterium]
MLRRRGSSVHREEAATPALTAMLWLSGTTLLVLLPHFFKQPWWLGGFCALLVSWRLLHDLKGRAMPATVLRTALTLAGVAAVLIEYRTLNGIIPGSALLALMLCLKLLETRTQRDAMMVILIGYFLVIALFLQDQSIFNGVYLFAVVMVLTTTLLVLNDPHPPPLRASVRHLRTAAILLAQALPMMILLFLLFPRLSAPLWNLGLGAHSARTGLSDELNMGAISDLADSQDIAFRVRFLDPPPPANQLYWRGPVLWNTDGRQWRGIDEAAFAAQLPATALAEAREIVRYQVILEPHQQRWLFALDLPVTLPDYAFLRFDYQLLHKQRISELMRYQMSSSLRYHTGSRPPRLTELTLARALPAQRNPQTLALAQQWRAAGLPAEEIVARALSYFREQPFIYTRQPPRLLGMDTVDEFLFDTRRGFCEHYAASFTTLMRAAGIPARIVTGYQGGELNPMGDYLIVRQSDAHAWSEVWLESRGWVRVDPTAAIPPERIETTLDSVRFSESLTSPRRQLDISWLAQGWQHLGHGWDAINYHWDQWVLGYGPEKQRQLLGAFGLDDFGWKKMIALLFALLGLCVVALAVYLLLHQTKTRDPVQRAFQRFCRALSRRGLQRAPHEGALDFARKAAAACPELSHDIHRITQQYLALRYGRDPSRAQISQLQDAVKSFATKCRVG